MDNLKQIICLAIDAHVPEIVTGKAELEKLTKEKQELHAKIDALNVELEEREAQVAEHEDWLMGVMETHNIKKMTTPKYAVERCRNANPTIEVIALAMVPKRYIVETPRVDKRYIQSEYSVNRIIPPGVEIKYGQYLDIVERRKNVVR